MTTDAARALRALEEELTRGCLGRRVGVGLPGAGNVIEPGNGGPIVTGFLLRRLGQSLIVMIGVLLVVFLVSHLLPGGPRSLLGLQANPVTVKQFYSANGYDRPLPVQFVLYVKRLITATSASPTTTTSRFPR